MAHKHKISIKESPFMCLISAVCVLVCTTVLCRLAGTVYNVECVNISVYTMAEIFIPILYVVVVACGEWRASSVCVCGSIHNQRQIKIK